MQFISHLPEPKPWYNGIPKLVDDLQYMGIQDALRGAAQKISDAGIEQAVVFLSQARPENWYDLGDDAEYHFADAKPLPEMPQDVGLASERGLVAYTADWIYVVGVYESDHWLTVIPRTPPERMRVQPIGGG